MTPHDDTDSLQIVPDPDKLDRYHRQQLSAMLDGELSPDQARFMLRRLQHDGELAGCWERWQVGGDVLRGQRNALLPADFAQKVSAAIVEDVEAPQVRSRASGPRLLRWGGGAALAASVAMAALLVGRQADIGPEQAPQQGLAELAASGGTVPDSPGQAPAPDEPVPAPGQIAGSAIVLAGAVAVAAETPRRGADRRARDHPQRDDASRVAEASRRAAAPQAAAVASAASAASDVAASGPAPGAEEETAQHFADLSTAYDGIGADPFKALPMTVASRPWPRAAGGAGGDYSVGLGSSMGAAAWPVTAGPQRQAVAELFGLPAEAAPGQPAATAIGARAIGAGEAPSTPAALLPGPR